MKLHQFWKLYGGLVVIDAISTLLLPFVWNMPSHLTEAYYNAALPEMIAWLFLDAIYAPMLWFLFVPFTERETRFGVAFTFGVTMRSIGSAAILFSGPQGFETAYALCRGVSLIIFAFSVVGLIVWSCGERKMSKAPATVAPQLDA